MTSFTLYKPEVENEINEESEDNITTLPDMGSQIEKDLQTDTPSELSGNEQEPPGIENSEHTAKEQTLETDTTDSSPALDSTISPTKPVLAIQPLPFDFKFIQNKVDIEKALNLTSSTTLDPDQIKPEQMDPLQIESLLENLDVENAALLASWVNELPAELQHRLTRVDLLKISSVLENATTTPEEESLDSINIILAEVAVRELQGPIYTESVKEVESISDTEDQAEESDFSDFQEAVKKSWRYRFLPALTKKQKIEKDTYKNQAKALKEKKKEQAKLEKEQAKLEHKEKRETKLDEKRQTQDVKNEFKETDLDTVKLSFFEKRKLRKQVKIETKQELSELKRRRKEQKVSDTENFKLFKPSMKKDKETVKEEKINQPKLSFSEKRALRSIEKQDHRQALRLEKQQKKELERALKEADKLEKEQAKLAEKAVKEQGKVKKSSIEIDTSSVRNQRKELEKLERQNAKLEKQAIKDRKRQEKLDAKAAKDAQKAMDKIKVQSEKSRQATVAKDKIAEREAQRISRQAKKLALDQTDYISTPRESITAGKYTWASEAGMAAQADTEIIDYAAYDLPEPLPVRGL